MSWHENEMSPLAQQANPPLSPRKGMKGGFIRPAPLLRRVWRLRRALLDLQIVNDVAHATNTSGDLFSPRLGLRGIDHAVERYNSPDRVDVDFGKVAGFVFRQLRL